MRYIVAPLLAAALLAASAGAQAGTARARPAALDSTLRAGKQMSATRIPSSSVRVDGRQPVRLTDHALQRRDHVPSDTALAAVHRSQLPAFRGLPSIHHHPHRRRPETYDRRYIFSFIDQDIFTTDLRANYTFKPDLSLELYAQPFAASGRYFDFGELPAPRSLDLRLYGTDGTTATKNADGSITVTDPAVTTAGGPATFTLPLRDFNIRSLRSNVVVRWEYRPGSTLFLVWQQDRSASEQHGRRIRPGDLFDGFSAAGDNFFAVKATFWLPVK